MAIPDIPVFSDTHIPQDEKPASSYEYACETCGTELSYGGRGRKPKFCEDHKPNRAKGDGTHRSRTSTGKNAQLAAQATAVLLQINGYVAMGLMLASMRETASALGGAQDGFESTTYEALLTDPDLCKTILKAGTTSGKVALAISYLMLGAAVVPVGIVEYKQIKADRPVTVEDYTVEDSAPDAA